MQDYHCLIVCSQRAIFLADLDFLRFMMKADKGAKILGHQGLYKCYSGLAPTLSTDIQWAINGLQEHIITALAVQGGFGVFFEDNESGCPRGLFRRSLLWHLPMGHNHLLESNSVRVLTVVKSHLGCGWRTPTV